MVSELLVIKTTSSWWQKPKDFAQKWNQMWHPIKKIKKKKRSKLCIPEVIRLPDKGGALSLTRMRNNCCSFLKLYQLKLCSSPLTLSFLSDNVELAGRTRITMTETPSAEPLLKLWTSWLTIHVTTLHSAEMNEGFTFIWYRRPGFINPVSFPSPKKIPQLLCFTCLCHCQVNWQWQQTVSGSNAANTDMAFTAGRVCFCSQNWYGNLTMPIYSESSG